jgi:DNA-binding beta-propeller fold protein YncE
MGPHSVVKLRRSRHFEREVGFCRRSAMNGPAFRRLLGVLAAVNVRRLLDVLAAVNVRRLLGVLAVLIVGAFSPWRAVAEFGPGKLYVVTYPAEPQFGPQRIYEVDGGTGAVSIFATLPTATFGVSGITFTPDGSRLLASDYKSNSILAFDTTGAYTVAYSGAAYGFSFPHSRDGLAYGPDDSLHAVALFTGGYAIGKIPADGGPVQKFGKFGPGLQGSGFMDVAPDGSIYYLCFASPEAGLNLSGILAWTDRLPSTMGPWVPWPSIRAATCTLQ